MWKLKKTTDKRLPTWIAGSKVSPYISNEPVTILDGYNSQPYSLSSIDFLQVAKLPFLIGFKFVDLGLSGNDNSQTRNISLDLNSCFFLTPLVLTSQQVIFEFYFTDLNFYTDLDWVNYYQEAVIYKDSDKTPYKVNDLKGLNISNNTLLKIRLPFDIFSPFLGIKPLIRQKTLIKIFQKTIDTNTVSYGGKTYKLDKFFTFGSYSFFNFKGDVYLCR